MPASTYRTIVVSEEEARRLDALAGRLLGLSLLMDDGTDCRAEAHVALRLSSRYQIGTPAPGPLPVSCVVCDDIGCEFCGSLVAHLAVAS